jgi:AcrR family transcriptional regulator
MAKQHEKPQPVARARNADATRTAILASARRAFARAGYDGAGLREIAAAAGVTAMMVHRYFGSKEQLFAAVIAGIMTTPIILTEENLASPALAAALAAGLVEQTQSGATPLDGFRIMLHSASSPQAADIGRVQIEQHYHRKLTAALRGDLAAERAAVVLALVAGVQVMRQMLALPALADASPAALIRILTPIFQQLVDGPRREARRRRRERRRSDPSSRRRA